MYPRGLLATVLRENAATLQEVACVGSFSFNTMDLRRLLGGAMPRLQTLRCDVTCTEVGAQHEAVKMLTSEASFGPLRLNTISVNCRTYANNTAALGDSAANHASLECLSVDGAILTADGMLEELLASAASRVPRLHLKECYMTAQTLPSLTRLLSTATLKEFAIAGLPFDNHIIPHVHGAQLFDGGGQSLAGFCAALRTSTLTKFEISGDALFFDSQAVLSACTGHPTIRALCFKGNSYFGSYTPEWVGVALNAIVDANSALTSLDVSDCYLRDFNISPLFRAVARSTRLRSLFCKENYISTECANDVVLPAVQINASLRELSLGESRMNRPLGRLRQAVELVQARAATD